MNKVVILALVAAISAVFFSSCSSILKKPDALAVKKIGIVSIYLNTRERSLEGIAGAVQGVAQLVTGSDKDKPALQEIMASAINNYEASLGSMTQWKLVDFKTLAADPNYKEHFGVGVKSTNLGQILGDLVKLARKDRIAIPFADAPVLNPDDFKKVGSQGTDILRENRRKALGELAGKLGLDAVAIIEMKIDYDLPLIATADLLEVWAAFPVITQRLLLINRQGVVVADTGDKATKPGRTKDWVNFLINPMYMGQVIKIGEVKSKNPNYGFTYSANPKIVPAVQEAISKAAFNLKEGLVEEFTKD